MARIKLTQPKQKKALSHLGKSLVQQLSEHLQDENSLYAQPLIYEYKINADAVRVVVIWDQMRTISLEQRTDIILAAYETIVEPPDIALASGLTVPEAINAGFLSFQVIPVVRSTDKITKSQCFELMKSYRASTLLTAQWPLLFFATEAEATKMIKILVEKEPDSRDVWTIISRQAIPYDDAYEESEKIYEFNSFVEAISYGQL